MKLNGISDWKLTPWQQKFLIESTQEMLEKHDLKWFEENKNSNRSQLEILFNGFLS